MLFVGASRDVDLDERDFRVGYLLSESDGDWRASLDYTEGVRI